MDLEHGKLFLILPVLSDGAADVVAPGFGLIKWTVCPRIWAEGLNTLDTLSKAQKAHVFRQNG